MPRRAGCQLGFLDQHDVVAPALLCQVIERADAHDPAADDDDLCLCFHLLFLTGYIGCKCRNLLRPVGVTMPAAARGAAYDLPT